MLQARTGDDLQADLIERSLRDPAFREALLTQPKDALERILGIQLAPHIRVTVHQESTDEIHLVLPTIAREEHPFSDEELEAVAGQVMCTSCNGSCAPSSKD